MLIKHIHINDDVNKILVSKFTSSKSRSVYTLAALYN